MVGYSTTPLVHKLGLKAGMKAVVLHSPGTYVKNLKDSAEDVQFLTKLPSYSVDFIQTFYTHAQDLLKEFPQCLEILKPAGLLWVSWYKKSAKKETDLDENVIRQIALNHGVVDVKVIAVDEEWSGLKIVRRVKDREPS
jgi:hypothetical protein